MSHVILLTADQPLPLYESQEHQKYAERSVALPGGGKVTIGLTSGFRVEEHCYFRYSVDLLGFPMKPFQYELAIEPCQTDVEQLVSYLRENLAPGDTAELWSLWVGSGGGERPRRYQGRLEEFDLETLGMLTSLQYEPDLTGEYSDGLISQVCVTVEI